MTVLSLYHNEPTFKRSRNFNGAYFFYFQFYPLLRCDFLTHQNQTGHFLWIAKSLQTQTSIWAGARFPSARPPKCTPKIKFIFSNTLSYQSERSFDEKSHFQAYKTHEASFSNFAKHRVNFTVSKTFFQITVVDEFDVIKK